jgi:endonuclease YncB( thermonuclease family)
MSIARNRSESYRSLARQAVQNWTAAADDLRFKERRVPPLLVIGAFTVIMAAISVFFIFKARSTPSPTAITKASEAIRSNPTVKTINAKAEADPSNWATLEPAYRSFRIQVGNDNSLQTDRHAVELYGINILPRSRICTYASGERWACGQRTYIALLNILGASTVDCRPPKKSQPHILICHLGGRDIAELMLREGWATLANGVTDKNYIAAAATASRSKSGMWSVQATRSMNAAAN